MKQIPLSTGGFTLVDEADYESLCQYQWHVSRCGHRTYARRYERINTENGKAKYATIRIHCQIMGHVPGMEIDHINGDGLDNRRENLRHCTRSQNIMNARKYKGKHKYKGVYLSGSGKWAAVIFKAIQIPLSASQPKANRSSKINHTQ